MSVLHYVVYVFQKSKINFLQVYVPNTYIFTEFRLYGLKLSQICYVSFH